MEIEAAGFEALPGLMEEFTHAALHLAGKTQPRKSATVARLMPAEVAQVISTTQNTYTLLRLVTDLVSGLTDRHALALFRKIKGISV